MNKLPRTTYEKELSLAYGHITDLTVALNTVTAERDDLKERRFIYEQFTEAAYEHTIARVTAERDALRWFVEAMAEGDCDYGDQCPTFGTRHGQCSSCRARAALAACKDGGEG